jgi:hypothetical protein
MGGAAAPSASQFASDRRKALQGQSGWVSSIVRLLLFLNHSYKGRAHPQWQSFRHCSVRVLGGTVRVIASFLVFVLS